MLISSITNDKEYQKFKRNVSITDELDKFLNKNKTQAVKNVISKSITPSPTQTIKSSQIKNLYVSKVENNLNFRQFKSHIPSWGGVIQTVKDDYENENEFFRYLQYNNLEFNNTCTIDYFLLAFWSVSKISNASSQSLKNLTQENKIARYFQKIIDLIDIYEWDRARPLWILSCSWVKTG